MKPIFKTILVVKNDIAQAGLKSMLKESRQISLIAVLSLITDLPYKIAELHPDLVIIDFNDKNEIAFITEFSNKTQNVKYLLIFAENVQELVKIIPNSKFIGILMQNFSKLQLHKSIDRLLDDKNHGNIEFKWVQENACEISLTRREKQVLLCITNGNTNREIAENLGICVKTADTHRTRLMKKLNTKNIAGVIKYAFEKGYIV